MIDRPPSLSIIIVSWNVKALLGHALDSITASWGDRDGLEIIVIDNASSDGTVDFIQRRYPHVSLIANADNRGFTGGNNQGIAAARGDYLLLLNCDTKVLGDALAKLVAFLEDHPDVGLVAPRLLNVDGTSQSSRRRFPTLATLFFESTWLQKIAPRRWLARYYIEDRPDTVIQDVDWVQGAAMLVRREVIDEVGGLDETFFMYSEELDWCRRIRQAGWRIVYLPSAEIIHYGGKSSEQIAPARHIYFQSSKVYYTRKYHGRTAAEILRLWLLAQYLWQMGIEAFKGLLGHRRELRRARVCAYHEVLKSGLHSRARPAAKVNADPIQADASSSGHSLNET